MRSLRHLAAAALALALVGCGPSAEEVAVDRAAIEEALAAYLPVLGEAYRENDAGLLGGHAAQKEIASINKLIRDLNEQGQMLRPTFKSMTVEDVDVWNYSNAYATTLEVWHVELVALGSGEVIGEDAEQAKRVKYQLKREDEGWLVLFRAVQE